MIAIFVALTIGQELDNALSAAIKRAAQRATPSIVRLDRVGGDGSAALTGVVIDADGRIATSAHVFESNTAEVVVTMADGARVPATQLGVDKVLHLAFLRVDKKSTPIMPSPSEEMRVGRYALAVGRGLTDTPTVSLGVISALHRVFGKAIQTDAKTSPINYGGPLLDLDGRAFGVIVPLSPDEGMAGTDLYDSGIGFAIPIADVMRSVERLKKGTIDRGLLGLAWHGKKPLDGPLVIEGLGWKSPVAEAGLRKGDTIKAVDGKPIAFYSQFRTAIGKLYSGDSVKFEFERSGRSVSAIVKAIAKLPVYRPPFMGLRLDEKDGKVVVQSAEGPAAATALLPNDVLVELDGPIKSLKEVAEKLKYKTAGDAFALVIERAGRREVKALRSAPWPETMPSNDAAIARSKVTLVEFPPPARFWLLQTATPKALIVVAGRSKPDEWRQACELYGVAAFGVEEGVESEVLKKVLAGHQKSMGLDPRRTAVFGPGPVAEFLANLVAPLAGGVAADGGPIAPPPAQPDDARPYLIIERPEDGSLVEAIAKARKEGVPIVEATLADSKPESAADVVARWAIGLGRF